MNDPASPQKQFKVGMFNTAILLTISAAFLYFLGWLYWQSYFAYFNIPVTFFDITFEQVAAFSGSMMLPFCFILLWLLIQHFANEPAFFSGTFGSVMICLFIISLILTTNILFDSYATMTLLQTGIGVYMLIIFVLTKGPWSKHLINKPSAYLFILMLIMGVLVITVAGLGRYEAMEVAAGKSKNARITLSTKSSLQPDPNAILIGHIKDKYVICWPRKNSEATIKVIIVHDSEVITAELLSVGK
jgi:hypothetical protein